jgi:hypothetical protein
VTPEHMVGALDEQGAEIDVAGLSDAELRVSGARLASSRSESQIATHIPASPPRSPTAHPNLPRCETTFRSREVLERLASLKWRLF